MSMAHQFLVVCLISFPYAPLPNIQILKKNKVLTKSVKQSISANFKILLLKYSNNFWY